MGHKAIRPGEQQCPTNTTSFTDYPLVANSTVVRKTHVDQVRTQINAELTRRAKSTVSFTDPTITANATVIRKVHTQELRDNIDSIQAPPSGYPAHSCPANQDACSPDIYCSSNTVGYCASDTVSYTWTDPTLAANTDKDRQTHMEEAMVNLNAEQATCVCEQEQCNFCPDCGYAWYTCSYSPCYYPACYCDDQSGCQFTPTCSPNSWYWAWSCATVDTNTADFYTAYAAHPCSGDTNPPDEVPWNCMCNFTPPGVAWSGTYYGYDRATGWGCKCNGFVNTGH